MVTGPRAFWAAFAFSVLREILILTESESGILVFSSNDLIAVYILSSERLLHKEDKTAYFPAAGFSADKAWLVKPTDTLSRNHLLDKGLNQQF